MTQEQGNQLAVRERQEFMPVLTIGDAVERYNAIVDFTKKVMQRDKDYGVIPGTNKPTLLKPGAEKLCTLFGLRPDFESRRWPRSSRNHLTGRPARSGSRWERDHDNRHP
jgi:hypothetical protein